MIGIIPAVEGDRESRGSREILEMHFGSPLQRPDLQARPASQAARRRLVKGCSYRTLRRRSAAVLPSGVLLEVVLPAYISPQCSCPQHLRFQIKQRRLHAVLRAGMQLLLCTRKMSGCRTFPDTKITHLN